MRNFLAHAAIISFFATIFLGSLWIAAKCDRKNELERYQQLIHGCRMVGMNQGYSMVLYQMPAQEQWECNGIMRTVNVVKD